jgi:ASCH domain
MKILTIRQPWAHLIANGSKNIENRTWSTSYRGPVLIHASLNIDRDACFELQIEPKTLLKGGVIGVAEITHCVTSHHSRWFSGPYGFVLRERQALTFIPWKGALGLREAPRKLIQRINLRRLRKYQC